MIPNSESGEEDAPWLRGAPGSLLQQAAPAEVVGQILRCHTMESPHPLLEPTVIGIHILDMEDPVYHAHPAERLSAL